MKRFMLERLPPFAIVVALVCFAVFTLANLLPGDPSVTTLQIIVAAVGLAFVAGATIGLVSGWIGGWVDAAIMRLMDAPLALGASDARIVWRQVWPNVSGNVIVYGSLAASQALVTESALSFLGLGAQPPEPSWGAMVANGMELASSWWMRFFPGLAIFLAVLAFNLPGDAGRDALDSRLANP